MRTVEQILDELSGDDRIAFASALDDAYRRGREDRERELLSRRERLAARDAAIRRALAEHYAGRPATTGAKALAADLGRYVAGPWLRERDLDSPPPGASQHRVALHKITRLNQGAPLAYRRILDISDGGRRRKCSNRDRSCTRSRREWASSTNSAARGPAMDVEQFKTLLGDGLKPLERAIDEHSKSVEARRAAAEKRAAAVYESFDRIESAIDRVHAAMTSRVEGCSHDAGAAVMRLCGAM